MSTPLLLDVAPEIDTNPTSFYRGRGKGVSPVGSRLRLRTLVIGSRSALAMSAHPTYFDQATPCPTARYFLLVLRVCPEFQSEFGLGSVFKSDSDTDSDPESDPDPDSDPEA